MHCSPDTWKMSFSMFVDTDDDGIHYDPIGTNPAPDNVGKSSDAISSAGPQVPQVPSPSQLDQPPPAAPAPFHRPSNTNSGTIPSDIDNLNKEADQRIDSVIEELRSSSPDDRRAEFTVPEPDECVDAILETLLALDERERHSEVTMSQPQLTPVQLYEVEKIINPRPQSATLQILRRHLDRNKKPETSMTFHKVDPTQIRELSMAPVVVPELSSVAPPTSPEYRKNALPAVVNVSKPVKRRRSGKSDNNTEKSNNPPHKKKRKQHGCKLQVLSERIRRPVFSETSWVRSHG